MKTDTDFDKLYEAFDGNFYVKPMPNQSGDAGFECYVRGSKQKVWRTYWAETKQRAIGLALSQAEARNRKTGSKMEIHTLAKKLALSAKWAWMPGMQVYVASETETSYGHKYRITEGTGPINSKRAYPDLEDAATIGCLLSLIQRAYLNDNICLVADETDLERPWAVRVRSFYNEHGQKTELCVSFGRTKAEALAYALLDFPLDNKNDEASS
jgi:hypothetical protein